MNYTTNYNLKKPAYTDFADIADINDNMDAIDAALHSHDTSLGNLGNGKLDKTGDAADAKVGSSTTASGSYPIPAANDTLKVILGKIIKFFSDIVNPFTGAASGTAGKKGLVPAPVAGEQNDYLRGDSTWQAPVNDATATTGGKVLDARMGKTLQDQITSLNDSLAVVSYTTKSVTIAAGAKVQEVFSAPTNTNYNWYCFNVNPATGNVNVLSHTAGGTAQLQNTTNASDTHTYTSHWIGIHK